jgi:fucose 4-O-acetylase-like acetyltransferase
METSASKTIEADGKSLERFADINVLKGIGILLVIFGHIHESTGPVLWQQVRGIIYTFHMPLFFIVSGFLYSYGVRAKPLPYKDYVKKIAPKFLIPFAAFSLIIMSYKLILQKYTGVVLKDAVTRESITWQLLNPQSGFAVLLWFLYALFLIQLAYPIILKILKNPYLILAVFLGLNYLNWPQHFMINQFMRYMPFFVLGSIAYEARLHLSIGRRISLVFAALCAILFFPIYLFLSDMFLTYFILGSLGTYCVWIVSWHLSRHDILNLAYVGNISIDIYLWHTTVIGIAILLLAFAGIHGFWLGTFIVFIVTVGINLLIAALLAKMPRTTYLLYGRKARS